MAVKVRILLFSHN